MLRQVQYKDSSIEYELKQTSRKNIECRITPGKVTLFVPQRCPMSTADAFILQRADWILNSLRQAGANAEAILKRRRENMQAGTLIPIEGKEYSLLYLPGAQTLVKTDGDRLIVFDPPKNPLIIREYICDYLIGLAKTRFPERIRFFAQKIGVQPRSVTLREQKTKWGSCSGRGNLNFNWKLIMAPPDALDYVVVHELCHLIELNHSPAFWALVKKYKPDYERWQNYLKNGIRNPFD